MHSFIRGSDLAPGGSNHYALENEPVPKSIARVLNSASLREQYRKRRRDDGVEGGNEPRPGRPKKRKTAADSEEASLRILVSDALPPIDKNSYFLCFARVQPGESLTNFNRCVKKDLVQDLQFIWGTDISY